MFRIETARQTGWRPGCLLGTRARGIRDLQGVPDYALGPPPLEPRTPRGFRQGE